MEGACYSAVSVAGAYDCLDGGVLPGVTTPGCAYAWVLVVEAVGAFGFVCVVVGVVCCAGSQVVASEWRGGCLLALVAAAVFREASCCAVGL